MAESKKASLTVLGGPRAHAGCELPDEGTVTIGSGEGCTLRLELPNVGALHAAVAVQSGRATVFDAGSGMPVHVNDSPVEAGGTLLRNGDILWLGHPGDEGVVMLQCILPRRVEAPAVGAAPVAAPAVPESLPHEPEPMATMALGPGSFPVTAGPLPTAGGEPAASGAAEPTPDIETTAIDLGPLAFRGLGGRHEDHDLVAPAEPGEEHVSPEPAPHEAPAPPAEVRAEAFDDAIETFAADGSGVEAPAEVEPEGGALVLEGDREDEDLVVTGSEVAAEAHAAEPMAHEPAEHEAEATFEPEPEPEPEPSQDSSTVMFTPAQAEAHFTPDFEDSTLVDSSAHAAAADEPAHVGAFTERDVSPTIVESAEPTFVDAAVEGEPVPTIVQAAEVTQVEPPPAPSEVEFEDETLAYVPPAAPVAPPAHTEGPSPLAPTLVGERTLAAAPEHPAAPEPAPPAHPTPPPVAERPRVSHPGASMGPTRREAIHGAHPPSPRAARAPAARAGGSRAGLFVALGVVLLALLGGVGYFGWKKFAAPAPSPLPPPTTLAQATRPDLGPPPVAATPEPVITPEGGIAPNVGATAAPIVAATPAVAPTATPRPAATAPTATATPNPRATPTPRATPAAAVTPPGGARPNATPPPTPAGPSPAQQAAAQAQGFAEQAEQALAARQFDQAIAHADAALKLEPGNARASAARAEAARRRDLARRRFVAGQTAVQTQKAGGGGLAGFDAGDAEVRQAPDFQGRIEFEMSPASGLDAGAAWTLRIFVVNDGKKPIRVQGVTVATNVNGAAGGGPTPAKTRDIAPQQRAQVGESAGTWKDGTTSWTTEVTVTANKGDSLRNTLSWR